jgi:hypothetical protein
MVLGAFHAVAAGKAAKPVTPAKILAASRTLKQSRRR